LLARRPRLIYAAIHGWREDGPYAGRPAYDDIVQGFVGVAGLMETLTGEPRYMPTHPASPPPDRGQGGRTWPVRP
jgi:crotonobetainyl-CoA:carnitine CoA-transferase CaiB-like acyl-CoA transferase